MRGGRGARRGGLQRTILVGRAAAVPSSVQRAARGARRGRGLTRAVVTLAGRQQLQPVKYERVRVCEWCLGLTRVQGPAGTTGAWQHDLYDGPRVKRVVPKPQGDLRQTLSAVHARTPRAVPQHEDGQLLISNLALSVSQQDVQARH